VSHSRLARALLRGVAWSEPEGVFAVRIGHFRGQIDVEDTAFFVVAFDGAQGEIDLSDGSSEALDPRTLRIDPDGVFRCRVKGRFPARFTRTGQAHLLECLEPCEAADAASWPKHWELRIGAQRVPIASVAAPGG
jgi:hypothetical protein